MTFGGPLHNSHNSRKINPGVINNIIIPTALQMSDDILKYWTSLTCLYDRYWTPNSEKITLPLCMFSITKITPTYTIETSNKRVILHEPEGSTNLDNMLRENVIRVISDNSVKQPTTYNVEAIVPFLPSKNIKQGLKTALDFIGTIFEHVGGNTYVNDIVSGTFQLLNSVNTTITALNRLPFGGGANYINVNSLEAMAESCRTLCLKMWTGYDYKHVEITGLTYEKRGTEDDVVRATFTLKERPVLVASRGNTQGGKKWRDWVNKTHFNINQYAHRSFVLPLEFLTGVRSENAANDRGESIRWSK